MLLAFPSRFSFAGENGPGLGVPNVQKRPLLKARPHPKQSSSPSRCKTACSTDARVLFVPHAYQTLHKRTITCECFS